MCSGMCLTGTEEDQAEPHDEGTIDEVLGVKTWKKGEPWKKLTEKLICLNKCLCLVTQSPRKNV